MFCTKKNNMKKQLLFILCILSAQFSFAKGNYIATGKIDGDFKIEIVDKNITLEPNQIFTLEKLGLKEVKVGRAPMPSQGKMGKGHTAGFWALCCIVPPILLPFAAMTTPHKPTAHHLNRSSFDIVIVKPDGKKYYAKMAFYESQKFEKRSAVSQYYSINIPSEKFKKLDDGLIDNFSVYEHGLNYITWLIWDVSATKKS